MWRQGDVLIQTVSVIPSDAIEREHRVLTEGAVTGHQHRVEPKEGTRLFERDGTLYLEVHAGGASVLHPEHGTIRLEAGKYRVWRQREYTGPNAARFVMD